MKRLALLAFLFPGFLLAQFGQPDPTFGFGDIMNQIQQGETNVMNALGNLVNTIIQKSLFPDNNPSTCNVNQPPGTGNPPGPNAPPGTAPTTGQPDVVTPGVTAVPASTSGPPPAPQPAVTPTGPMKPCGSRSTNGNGMPNNQPSPNSSTSGGPGTPSSTPTTPPNNPTSPFIDTVVTVPPEEDPSDPEPIPILPECDPQADTPVYMVDHAGGTVQMTKACSGQSSSVNVTTRPLQAALTPDGTQLLVTNFDNAITFINTANFTVSGTIQTDYSINPSGIAISPDGSTAYVTSFNNTNPVVAVVNIAQRQITQTFQTCDYVQSVSLTPDGQLLFVTCPFNNTVYVYDTLTYSYVGGISTPQPSAVAFNPTGTQTYIAGGGSQGQLQVVDTSSLTTLKTVPLGNSPEDILVNQNGRLIFVSNGFDGTITQVVPGVWQTSTINVGINVHGLAWVE